MATPGLFGTRLVNYRLISCSIGEQCERIVLQCSTIEGRENVQSNGHEYRFNPISFSVYDIRQCDPKLTKSIGAAPSRVEIPNNLWVICRVT